MESEPARTPLTSERKSLSPVETQGRPQTKTQTLDALFDFLSKDGEWHTLNEISTINVLRHIPITNLREILNCLNEYDLIELNESGTQLGITETRITPKMQTFWRRIKWIERARRKLNASKNKMPS